MRGSRWLAVAVAVASVSTGVAVAGGGWSETNPVLGDFEADLVKQKERRCDSKHVKVELRFKGTQTSNDKRLEGDLEVNVESVVNTKNGWGYTKGTVKVRNNERGHKTKFRGEVVGVVEPDGGAEGFLTGRTEGRGSVRLFANFNVDQDPATGAITGEFGKDTQEQKPYAPEEHQDPAVLTNACLDKHHGHGHGDD
jgi:predicted PhzF superfamily epimerase YddE/YHI9